jgi:hypothetical protein
MAGFRRHLNRVDPAGPPQAYQTFQAAAPLRTHWRQATCAEVECAHHIHGWVTTVLAGSEDEALIRRAGRAFAVERQEGGFLRFTFHAGQPCFAAHRHRVPLERDPLFIVRGGDWRASTGLIRRHTRGVDWVDDFATHQDQLIARQNRG